MVFWRYTPHCTKWARTSSWSCQYLSLVKIWLRSNQRIKRYSSLSAVLSMPVILLEETTVHWQIQKLMKKCTTLDIIWDPYYGWKYSLLCHCLSVFNVMWSQKGHFPSASLGESSGEVILVFGWKLFLGKLDPFLSNLEKTAKICHAVQP